RGASGANLRGGWRCREIRRAAKLQRLIDALQREAALRIDGERNVPIGCQHPGQIDLTSLRRITRAPQLILHDHTPLYRPSPIRWYVPCEGLPGVRVPQCRSAAV